MRTFVVRTFLAAAASFLVTGTLGADLAALTCGVIGVTAGVFLVAIDARQARRLRRLARLVRELGHPQLGLLTLRVLLTKRDEAIPVLLQALSAPTGVAAGSRLGSTGVVTWDSSLARMLATEGLGHLKAVETVAALARILKDSDPAVRARAIWALGEIGDARAVPALIPLLGDDTRLAGHPVGEEPGLMPFGPTWLSEMAAGVLFHLGEGELVEAFRTTMRDGTNGLAALKCVKSREVIEALANMVDSPHPVGAINAARALGELNAIAALPRLRTKVGAFSSASTSVKEACAQTIAKLEAFAALPRPAESTMDTRDLPRASVTPMLDEKTLPRSIGN